MLLERSKRWTKDEYQKLTTIFPEGVRVELVEGVLVEISLQHPQHSYCVAKLSKALTRGLPESYTVRVQLPLDLTEADTLYSNRLPFSIKVEELFT